MGCLVHWWMKTHFAYTAGMSQSPQPSCNAISVASVAGQGARSVLHMSAPASRSSEVLALLVALRRDEADGCSASCSALCPGDVRAVGLVALAITVTRLGRYIGGMAAPRLGRLGLLKPSLQ